jgi:beta-glucosidase-like glycosyl hydrolase
MAASWDTSLMRRVGEAFGEELIHYKANQIYAPALNIIKHPLAGRNSEYFSEDPFLSGQIAAAEVTGIQNKGCIATVKHFACNSFETGRFQTNITIDERVLREIYLPAFQMCTQQSKVKSLMTAYNSVNGHFMSANNKILNILYKEWGFEGFIISDWGAVMENAASALKAGSCIEFPGWKYFNDKNIEDGFKDGSITKDLFESHLRHILEMKLDTSIFNPQSPNKPDHFSIESQRKLAAEISENSIVLLKNNKNILPVKENQSVALIGPFADSQLLVGNQGSSTVFPERIITIKQALEERLGKKLSFSEGCKALTDESTKLLSDFTCNAEYFNNLNCEGRPVLVREENSITKLSFSGSGNASTVQGVKGKGFYFSGQSNLKCGTLPPYEKDQDFTWSFWTYLDDQFPDKTKPVFSSYIWGVFNLNITPSGLTISLDELQSNAGINAEMPPQKWINVVIVRRNGKLELYYNGEKKGDTDFSFPINEAPIYLGGTPDGEKNANCKIDEVNLFSRALSPDEINGLAGGVDIIDSRIFHDGCEGVQSTSKQNESYTGITDHTNMSARWTGAFIPHKTGKYYFCISSNSGIRFFINEKKIIDQWQEAWIEGKNRQCWIPMQKGKKYSVKIEYTSIFEKQRNMGAYVKFQYAEPDENQIKMINEAVTAAKKKDIVVVVVGIPQITIQGEANDNDTYNLTGYQDELINAVSKANPNTIVVLCSAGGVGMQGWIDKVPALLEAFFPGQEGGYSVSDILYGKVNPSGKLPVTYPVSTDQLKVNVVQPVFEKSVCGFGYRMFDRKNKKPQFPFGYGLSYTAFLYSGLAVKKVNDNSLIVSFKITNTGKRAGAEVGQVYVSQLKCSEERPVKELKGFSKVFLNPGESKTLTVYLDKRAFQFYSGKQKNWIVESGEFNIEVGSSSRDIKLKDKIRL